VGQRGHSKSRGLSFFKMEKETKIINREEDFFCTPRIASAVNSSTLPQMQLLFITMVKTNLIMLSSNLLLNAKKRH
jgi:hypothetical protein